MLKRLAILKCDLEQDKNLSFGLEKLIQNLMHKTWDFYARGNLLRHLRHKQLSAFSRREVSRCSSEKHQQVSLPKLMSHMVFESQEGHWWVACEPESTSIICSRCSSFIRRQLVISSMVRWQPLHKPPLFLHAATQGVFTIQVSYSFQ